MKSSKPSLNYNPFEELKGRLKDAAVDAIDRNAEAAVFPPDGANGTEIGDDELFASEMANVIPLDEDRRVVPNKEVPSSGSSRENGEREGLERLEKLISSGEGFVVEDTPEYVEGFWHTVHPEVARRLHRGEFSIQDHIDLHGHTVEDAKIAFDSFLSESIAAGKRAVLIVHGRGLSSPIRPVLKAKVVEWLTHRPWWKWIIAFTSARACDGGAGATYILLRRRPLTKRQRRVKK